MRYLEPEMEMVKFETVDVITLSGGGATDNNMGSGESDIPVPSN